MKIKRYTFNFFVVGTPIIFILSLISGYRLKSGADYNSYSYIFNYISENKYEFYFEPLFFFLYKMAEQYADGNLYVALMANIIAIYGIFKFSPKPFISLVFYVLLTNVYLVQFNITRQSLAMPFIFVFAIYFFHKNYLKASFAGLLGVFSHYASFFPMLVMYFIPKKRFNLYIIIGVLSSIYVLSLIGVFDNIMRSLFLFLPGKFENYAGYEYLQSRTTGFRFLLDFIWFIIIYLFIKKKDDEFFNFISNMVLLGLIISFIAIYTPIFFRISYFFLFFQIIFYSYIFSEKYIKNRFNRIVLGNTLILYYFVIFLYSLSNNIYSIFPYKNVLLD
ncbi:EpsG-like putative glucosyltransferase [Tenacibaculum lutimaris]|uniref:EpsG-like putative glucosyltransferase n=1 Tax=Tenacibaculum lutimaris TaxID=285258 RepID=A0A420DYC6_9FLAO|nr:EpsG family protein [Tenacibaculum lutimaris]RKF02811.1 EpsG-like putative glucosyltransferase [Tenacibaculum lutimaris]